MRAEDSEKPSCNVSTGRVSRYAPTDLDRPFEEERGAALEERLLEWLEPLVRTEERCEQLRGALRRQAVQPELRVSRSCRPNRKNGSPT